MILKKTNAVLGLMIIAAVICHAGTMTFSLITFWYDFAICKFFAHAAVTFMILHALMSICLFFFQHDGSDMRYSRQNMRTLLQRITAVVMIVLIHFHTSAYAHMATGETLSTGTAVFRCITECIYILSVFLHTAMSFSRALVTLGWISSMRTAARIDRFACIVCGLAAICSLFAVIRFFL